MVDARLPNGHRVNIVIPPIALDGPTITIRKFTDKVMSLEEMESKGSFDERVSLLFAWAVKARKNIAVCGGTGSGKTTLLNALSCIIAKEERIVTIEDSAELRFTEHPHVVRLESRARNAEGVGEVSIRDLCAQCASNEAGQNHRGGMPGRGSPRYAPGHEYGSRRFSYHPSC